MTALMNTYPGTSEPQESVVTPNFRRAAGVVFYFFADQMTSPRPQAILEGTNVDMAKPSSVPAAPWPTGFVEQV